MSVIISKIAALTAQQVKWVRKMLKTREMTQTAVALKLGVTQATISHIFTKKTYRNVI